MNLEDVMKALAHPARLEMLIWLKNPKEHFGVEPENATEGISAGQFERCGLSQSTVSAHLSTLQRAGLLISKRDGQKILYRRNEDLISEFRNALNNQL